MFHIKLFVFKDPDLTIQEGMERSNTVITSKYILNVWIGVRSLRKKTHEQVRTHEYLNLPATLHLRLSVTRFNQSKRNFRDKLSTWFLFSKWLFAIWFCEIFCTLFVLFTKNRILLFIHWFLECFSTWNSGSCKCFFYTYCYCPPCAML